MYKLSKSNSNFDIMYAINGNDIYNSKFLYDLDNLDSSNILSYKNLLYVGRLDLVANTIYDNTDTVPYEIVSILNRFDQKDNTEYTDVNYVPETTIRTLRLG